MIYAKDLDDNESLTGSDKEFVGSIFKYKDNVERKVVGWKGKIADKTLFVIYCPKCAEDSELYGEGLFTGTVSCRGERRLLYRVGGEDISYRRYSLGL